MAGRCGILAAKESESEDSGVARSGSMRSAGMCGGRCAAMDCVLKKASSGCGSPGASTHMPSGDTSLK